MNDPTQLKTKYTQAILEYIPTEHQTKDIKNAIHYFIGEALIEFGESVLKDMEKK